MELDDNTGSPPDWLNRGKHPWSSMEASLTISHPTLAPNSVSTQLRLIPTSTTEPGSALRSADGFWVLTFTGDNRDESNAIEAALATMRSRSTEIAKLRESGMSVALTVYGHVTDGSTLSLSSSSVHDLAMLGIPLILTPNPNQR